MAGHFCPWAFRRSSAKTSSSRFTWLRSRREGLKALLQAGVGRLPDQLRQGLQDLVLGVIEVLQTVPEEIVQRFDVF